MLSLYCTIKARLAEDRGVTAVEYGLILAAIVAVIGATVWLISGQVATFFTDANTAITKK
jgi:Flp pilus assembly pilin Flp